MNYDELYAAMVHAPTLLRIWQDAYGADYPVDAEPYGFVTVTDLQRMVEELRMSRDQMLVDLACGRGGPGLWVARATGARLLGIDASAVGVAQAQQRAQMFGLHDRATFQAGDVAVTGLAGSSVDGVMSVDALEAFRNKTAAAREIARILRPNTYFVCTAWDSTWPSGPPGSTQPVNEAYYRAVLEDAGLAVEVYEEIPNWKRGQLSVYLGVLRQRAALQQELGEALSYVLQEAARGRANLEHSRRVFIVARRT